MATSLKSTLESALRVSFRLPAFRLGQQEIIEDVLAQKDVLAVLPTGGGKSLCYQLPAVVENKLVIVISPLIALMKDQVAGLTARGIPAGSVHSGQTEAEKMRVFTEIAKGGTFLLYVSPERVAKEGFQRWIMNKPIALFAVDEAHCISQWGHDFREEYGQLNVLKKLRPDVPVLALTASATPIVLRDVAKRLGLADPARHVHGFYRPNLYYQVETCEDEERKEQFLHQAIEQTPDGRIIVYCGTRKTAESVCKQLKRTFLGVDYYHAGLSSAERTTAQDAYHSGENRILVATNAFGMGIDHPDVRLVVHFHMPGNIDSLYQEMGRAGRDGDPSTCLMLYSKKDKGLQSFFITQSGAPPEIKKNRWNTLDALVNYSEGGECRHSGILTYYQDSQRIEACGHCDSCDPTSPRRIQRPPRNLVLPSKSLTKKQKEKKATMVAEEGMDGTQKLRLAALKDWRKSKAKELDVAAFMVFSDKTLRHLAEVNPSSREQLQTIYGIGEQKLEAFGTELLAELGSFGG
jgi:ATP-dependent DNA helicase RecQ